MGRPSIPPWARSWDFWLPQTLSDKLHSHISRSPSLDTQISAEKKLERNQNTSQVELEKILYLCISWFIECKRHELANREYFKLKALLVILDSPHSLLGSFPNLHNINWVPRVKDFKNKNRLLVAWSLAVCYNFIFAIVYTWCLPTLTYVWSFSGALKLVIFHSCQFF